MKKLNKKKVKRISFIVISRMTLVVVLAIILAVFPTIKIIESNEDGLFSKFIGNKSEYQGIIKLWNVDTFEGGSSSRASYLENLALAFEKKNKGLYIKVENITPSEMIANINIGVYPHLFSFGTGVAGYLKEKMIDLPGDFAKLIRSNFYSAGLMGSSLKAVAWAVGGYSLISTSEKIENAGKEVSQELKSFALNLAYDKTYKKSTRHINSLTFGCNQYTNGLDAYSRAFYQSAVEMAESGVIDQKYNTQTPYDAYLSFITGKSSMLLGTQRDIYRMENRLVSGAEVDVIYQPLGEYTDLVNYISVIKSEKTIQNMCIKFISFMLTKENQLKLESLGMLSPTNYEIYQNGVLKRLEKAIGEATIVKSLF